MKIFMVFTKFALLQIKNIWIETNRFEHKTLVWRYDAFWNILLDLFIYFKAKNLRRFIILINIQLIPLNFFYWKPQYYNEWCNHFELARFLVHRPVFSAKRHFLKLSVPSSVSGSVSSSGSSLQFRPVWTFV